MIRHAPRSSRFWNPQYGATFAGTAFCFATNATGVSIQPPASDTCSPCTRGHFFVLIADRDHVFFDYTPKEKSDVVAELFSGYSGYILADAKSVYNLLFLPPHLRKRKPTDPPDMVDTSVRIEVGCWADARCKFWDPMTLTSAA